MGKTKAKIKLAESSTDTADLRMATALKFKAGDRVSHRLTNAQGTFVEVHTGFALPECWVNFDTDTEAGFVPRSCSPLDLELIFDKREALCLNSDPSICAVGLEPVSHSECLSLEDSGSLGFVKTTNSVILDCEIDSQKSPFTPTSNICPPSKISISFPVPRHANHFHSMGSGEDQMTGEIASPILLELSPQVPQDSSLLKTCQDFLPALTEKAATQGHISGNCSLRFTHSGTMQNGFVSDRATLAAPSLGKDCCWLASPGALSSMGTARPPGLTKSENQWQKLGLLKKGEVANPDFLEDCFGLPKGWTSPQESRPAQQLLEQDDRFSEIRSTGESPRSHFVESSISTPCSDDRERCAITKDGYLALALISTDGGTQSRAGLNDATIDEYAEAMDAGTAFPPILIFYDGEEYWLADGFHRVAAAKRLEWTDIAVEIRSGTRRNAVLYSVGANAAHGLRRTNADKRRAVETLLRDKEWSQWSNREIARRCGVGDHLVGQLRNSICVNHADTNLNTECDLEIPEIKVQESTERVVYRGGKTFTQDTEKIGKTHKITVDSCQKGGVYMIQAKRDPELRRFDGEWAIAKEVNEYSITIALRREDIPVAHAFLKEVDPEHWAEIQAINDRIDRLFQCELDPIDDASLELLKRRTCFTDRQKLVLKRMEEDYGLVRCETIR